MQKKVILFLTFFVVSSFIFSQEQFILGEVTTNIGSVQVIYIKDKNDYIRVLKHEDKKVYQNNIYVDFFIPQELKDIRDHIDKFEKWHKIAIENKSVLNKVIGTLKTFKIEFMTLENKYYISFVSSSSGLRLMYFTLENIKIFKEIISDENMDKVLNEEKRKKEKLEELFQ